TKMTFDTAYRLGRPPLAILAALVAGAEAHAQTDPLPSWNDGAGKQAIITFVRATTTSGPRFVAPEARIATFDQDGTLWVEHPMYAQVMYCLDRVPAVVKKSPSSRSGTPRSERHDPPAVAIPAQCVGVTSPATNQCLIVDRRIRKWR